MEALEHKEEEQPSVKKTKLVSFPIEIIEDILLRLPVKSILRFRAVSKPWLSLISDPSFNKLQLTRGHHTGYFISAYDHATSKRYYLTVSTDGGPITKLMTVHDDIGVDTTGPSYLNGFVCFTSETWIKNHACIFSKHMFINSQAFVVNPCTRKSLKLPCEDVLSSYLYGLDEYRNELKILLMRKDYNYMDQTREFMIFSMSSYSWRKIHAEPPVGFSWDLFRGGMNGGVCVNSIVHLMLDHDFSYDILAFDFVEEKFSVISKPKGALPHDLALDDIEIPYTPSITKIDGCLGVVLYDGERSEVGIWLLQDYDKRVWVKETIKLPEPWNDLVGKNSLSIDVNMDDEIVFCLSKLTGNMVTIPVYNRKSKCFESLRFTLSKQLLSSKTLKFCHINCYVESITPL